MKSRNDNTEPAWTAEYERVFHDEVLRYAAKVAEINSELLDERPAFDISANLSRLVGSDKEKGHFNG